MIAPTLEIDTVAPVITAVSFDRFDATLTVTFQDNLSGMDLASVENSAFYHLSAKPLAKNVHVPAADLAHEHHGDARRDAGRVPWWSTVVFHHGKKLRGGLYDDPDQLGEREHRHRGQRGQCPLRDLLRGLPDG